MQKNVSSESSSRPAGRTAPLVPFLFGVAQRARLPGTELIRLLTDLGLTEAAARALLLRMRQEGKLASIRRGRGADYELAGEYGRRFERIRRADQQRPAEWTGSFHALLYQVPESHRAYRDALRRAAVHLGYGLLQQGVLIAMDDRTDQLGPLADPPAGVRVFVTRLAMSEADAARAAFLAWDLDALNRLYDAHVQTLRTALRELSGPPEPGPDTLRRYADLLRTPMVDTLRSPRLPGTLFPDDWSMPRLWQAIGEVQRVFGGPAAGYVAQRLAG